MIETLESIKENEHVKMHFDSDVMDFKQTISFSENNGETTIKSESQVMGKNIMMKSMFALMEMMGSAFQKQEEININGLKKVIESNTTDYFPAPIQLDQVPTSQPTEN